MNKNKPREKEVNPEERNFLESEFYLKKKEELYREINFPVYKIDRSVFKKSPADRDRLLEFKLKNRFERKKHFGTGYKKYLNVPDKQMEIAKWFVEAFRLRDTELTKSIRLSF